MDAIVTKYKNSTRIKLKNKRVFVDDIDNNDIGITFKILCSKEDAAIPSASHRVEMGVIKVTKIRISEEAAISLYYALMSRLATRVSKTKT